MYRSAAGLCLLAFVSCAKQIKGPAPSLSSVTPSVVCNDQHASVVAISGKGLSPLNDRTLGTTQLEMPKISLLPRTALDKTPLAGSALVIPDDPQNPTRSDVTWTSQEAMAFSLCPPGTCSTQTPTLTDLAALPAGGLYSVEVANRNGRSVTFADSFVIVPVPILTSESVDLLCEDHPNQVTFNGDNFYSLNGTPVNIAIGGQTFTPTLEDCRALPAPQGTTLQACSVAHVTIPAKTFSPGTQPVHVVGPASIDCQSTTPLTITFVPEPTLQAIVPDLICDAQSDRSLSFNGSGFLTVDGVLPTVRIGAHTFSATSASGCTRVTGPTEAVQSCTTLQLALPQNTLAPESADVTVTNPPPADCTTEPAVNLTVLPAPTLTQVISDFACNAQATTHFTLTGTGFVRVGSNMPTVALTNGTQTVVTLPAVVNSETCTALTGPTETAASCTELRVDVPAATLTDGTYAFTVTNPDPVGCATTQPLTTVILPPPTVTQAAPAPLCTAEGAAQYDLSGAGFVFGEGTAPTVTLTPATGGALSLTATAKSGTCSPLGGVSESVQVCTSLSITVPMDGLAVGTSYALVVTNPDPAACSSTDVASVVGVAPPTITDVAPVQLCHGGGQITLTGTNFLAGTTVKVGPLATTSLTVNETGTAITAQVGAGLTAVSSYPVQLDDAAGCVATAAQQISIVDGPLIFFADPPTVWNGATTQITVYGSNVTAPYASVSLVPSAGGAEVPLTLTLDAQHQNRVHATVPAGTPAGAYDVVVRDASPCPAILNAGLKVVSATSFSNLTVTPNTGFSGVDTAVQIKSAAAFEAIPRAYLTPSGGTGGTATALTSLSYIDSSTLAAVVPEGTLATGDYDLIIVNPDGSVGVQAKTSTTPAPFTVVPNPAPLITTLSPGVINFQSAQTFNLVGANFQSGATVGLSCQDQNGAAITTPSFTQGACGSGTASTCIAVTITINTAGACVVSVTNPDGGRFDFSSLVVQNPALKLGTFRATTSMTTARRALGIATGQATPTARFLYAFGGDDGTEAHAVSTVEASTIDVFGNMGRWFALRNAMQHPRTFVGSTGIGRFIYAVGGSDGTGAVTSVERAAVLDPTNVPSIEDLDLAEGNGTGLDAGLYVYRVSPVMDDSDAFNPGGEGLASDPFVVQVPTLADKIHLTLSWSAFPGVKGCPTSPTGAAACGYRVYRSPIANATPGTEVLIADNVAATSLVDTGLAPVQVNSANVSPLPVGATGVWTSVSTLSVARSGAAVTAITDPSNPAVTYLYAMGGNSATEASPAVLATTELLAITTASDGSQTFGTWTAGPNLNTARWQAGGFALKVGSSNYVWAGAGRTASGLSSGIDGALIGANGLPGAFTSLTHQMGQRAGYAAIAVNGFLFALGGTGGSADTAGVQGQVSTAPQVANWPFSTALSTARVLMGSTLQSGFIFVCGGGTGAASATSACESTIW